MLIHSWQERIPCQNSQKSCWTLTFSTGFIIISYDREYRPRPVTQIWFQVSLVPWLLKNSKFWQLLWTFKSENFVLENDRLKVILWKIKKKELVYDQSLIVKNTTICLNCFASANLPTIINYIQVLFGVNSGWGVIKVDNNKLD